MVKHDGKGKLDQHGLNLTELNLVQDRDDEHHNHDHIDANEEQLPPALSHDNGAVRLLLTVGVLLVTRLILEVIIRRLQLIQVVRLQRYLQSVEHRAFKDHLESVRYENRVEDIQPIDADSVELIVALLTFLDVLLTHRVRMHTIKTVVAVLSVTFLAVVSVEAD